MKTALCGTLTQIDNKGHEGVKAYYSKRFNLTKENYTSNERKLLGLVYFLKSYMCHLEGSLFAVFIDNQVYRDFTTKKHLSRREARWSDLSAEFNSAKNTLLPRMDHVFRYQIYRKYLEQTMYKLQMCQLISHLFKTFLRKAILNTNVFFIH